MIRFLPVAKKTLLVAMPLLAGAAWASTTALTGVQTRAAYEAFLAQLGFTSSFVLQPGTYTRGVISSEATTRVSRALSIDTQPLLYFTLKHVIEHAPVSLDRQGAQWSAARIVTTLAIDEASVSVRQLAEAFPDSTPFRLTSLLGFDGTSVHQLDINKAHWSSDTRQGSFDGATLELRADESGVIRGTGNLPGLVLTSESGSKMTLSDGQYALDFQRMPQGHVKSRQSLNMASVVLQRPDTDKPLSMTDSRLVLEGEVRERRAAGTVQFDSGDIDAALPLNSLNLKVSLNDIATDTLSSGDGFSNLLVSALHSSTKGDAELALRNSNGAMRGTLDWLNKRDAPQRNSTPPETLGELLESLQASLSVDADAAALRGTPIAAIVASPLASQFVDFDGSAYRSRISLDDLVLNANGKLLPLQFLLANQLALPLAFGTATPPPVSQ